MLSPEKKPNKLRYGIATKFFMLVMLVSTVISLTMTAIYIYSEYKNAKQEVEMHLEEIQDNYMEAMTSYAWIANYGILQKQLNGIAKKPHIQFLELKVDGSKIITSGQRAASYYETREYPLVHKYKGQDITLGTLRVSITLDAIKDSLLRSATETIAMQVIMIFVISVLINYLFNLLVGKHLNRMANYTKTLSMNKLETPLCLDRSGLLYNSQDELSLLSNSINRMRERLIEDIGEREQAEETFQAIVQSTVGNTGQKLFDKVCIELCTVFEGECAIVGELTDSDTIRAVAMVVDGKPVKNYSYKLPGTPCQEAATSGFCHYPDDIAVHFPEDKDLQDMGAVGYVGTPLKDYKGTVIGVICVVSKNTMTLPTGSEDLMNIIAARTSAEIERIKEEREKNKLYGRLQQAQKMEAIGTLAGGIAHDFNNILGVILGYAEMAKDDAPPGTTYGNDLEKVLTAAHRAKDLVKQILAFSRQAGIERIPLKIQPLIREGLKMLRSSIPSTISITEDIDPGNTIILADPTQIHQILMNLCTNAFQAMEEKGGTLSIAIKSTFLEPKEQADFSGISPGEYVELTVADTGDGIPPGVMAKIFDPYFTTKEIGKGTGMGLAIIHGIVQDYGGTITVETEVSKGSTFHVYFPAVEKESVPEISDCDDIAKGKERILFVDDEELLANMGKDMLERLGYHVTVRRSSLEALATFQNTPMDFDLVITDQTMPDMTGLDLSRRMMQIRPDVPIILCTGYSNLVDADSAKALGIKEFALKPLTMKVLAELIRNVLDVA